MHYLLGIVFILTFVAQAARVLLLPVPQIDFTSAALVDLQFTDQECTAAALLAAGDYENQSGSHPSDNAQQRRCISDEFELGDWPALLARYAGNPRDPEVRVGLDLDRDDAIDLPWALGNAAHHGWLISVLHVPPKARQGTARLIIEDRSTHSDGWIIIRDLVQFTGDARGLSGIEAWPRYLAVWSAVLIAACILLLVRAGYERVAFTGLAALLAIEFLNVSAFYKRDEYTLMTGYADGIDWRELVAYYDQFAPILLSLYAGLIALVRDWYAPLQVMMLAGHVATIFVLKRLLDRHGFAWWITITICLLYATTWSHINVVPWFIHICFLASTGLTLVAIERTAAHVQGSRRALGWAVAAAATAPFVFVGGVVAPWLCIAYLLIFDLRNRTGLVLFTAVGVVTCALVLLTTSALQSAQNVAGGASILDMLSYLLEGMLAGSLASLLALRGSAWLAIAGLATAGLVILALSDRRQYTNRAWRLLFFGLIFMTAGYALQAVVRTNSGFGDALANRYTYFGMTGAAFAVSAWLQPLASTWDTRRDFVRRAMVGIWIAFTLAAVGMNVKTYQSISAATEHEYFDINRQYFALTVAALRLADERQLSPPPGLVPNTIFPGNQTATPAELTGHYRGVVCYLADCSARGPVRESTDPAADSMLPVWRALLAP